MNTFSQNGDVNLVSPETTRTLLSIVETLLNHYDSVEERVSLTEERLGLVEEEQYELRRFVEEVVENSKESQGKPRK